MIRTGTGGVDGLKAKGRCIPDGALPEWIATAGLARWLAVVAKPRFDLPSALRAKLLPFLPRACTPPGREGGDGAGEENRRDARRVCGIKFLHEVYVTTL